MKITGLCTLTSQQYLCGSLSSDCCNTSDRDSGLAGIHIAIRWCQRFEIEPQIITSGGVDDLVIQSGPLDTGRYREMRYCADMAGQEEDVTSSGTITTSGYGHHWSWQSCGRENVCAYYSGTAWEHTHKHLLQ